MSELKQPSQEVIIKDLRILGRQGGATAYLVDGQEMILDAAYGLIRRQGIVFGEMQTVEIIEQYTTIYSKIRTIKRDDIVIARRVQRGNKSVLLLTGKGYKRPKN